MPGLTAIPGDLLLVHRRRTVRSFLAGPTSALISWRIQSLTGSPWNHVAIFDSHSSVIEANWSGVKRVPLIAYQTPRDARYGLRVVHRPKTPRTTPEALRDALRWLNGQRGDPYDPGLLGRMRWAALKGGMDALRAVHLDYDLDGAWICSELAQAFWLRAGVRGGPWVYPGGFLCQQQRNHTS